MDNSVITQLGAIVTAEGSRQEGPRWPPTWSAAPPVHGGRGSTRSRTPCRPPAIGWCARVPQAYPSFAVTEGLTAHAIRAGALALSNDVSRDPRYLATRRTPGLS